MSNALQILYRELNPDEYSCPKPFTDLTFLVSEYQGGGRWDITHLDVYYHAPSDTYGGVLYSVPATEMQECDDPAEVVEVERDPTPRFRVKR
jgi:hypothetical protein